MNNLIIIIYPETHFTETTRWGFSLHRNDVFSTPGESKISQSEGYKTREDAFAHATKRALEIENNPEAISQ